VGSARAAAVTAARHWRQKEVRIDIRKKENVKKRTD
jgi:hypothetical protein